MYLRSLSLTNFRNYARQDLELEPGRVLLLGENAQGKTNVLEAVFLLATGRSERASVDADFIAWDVRGDAQPVARVMGKAVRASGEVSVEVTIAGRPGANGLIASKRLKLNGVAKRAADVVGTITAVLFTTDDMELVKGSPGGRRRYLDVMLTQAERPYARALQQYNKLITQRNALLKQIQSGESSTDELGYWDEELARHGATLLRGRAGAAIDIAQYAAEAHAHLSGAREDFRVSYAPRFDWPPERVAEADEEEIAEALVTRLRATHQRDVAAGITLSGPHRDDLAMMLGGEPAASFASRGQQRTAALALRLAEARLLHARSGERPILLLDDVLSELDEHRRAGVLDAIDADQALITSPDPDRFPAEFEAAQRLMVSAGTVTAA